MNYYLLSRFGRAVIVLLLVTALTAFLIDLAPGDPAVTLVGEGAGQEVLDAVTARYGFDDPPHERYAKWLGRLVQGDLGESFRTNESVARMIQQRAPVSLQLAAMALVLALLVAVPSALFTAYRPRSAADQVVNAATSAVLSVPVFLLSILLLYVAAVQFRWFPVSGWVPLTEDPVGNLRSALLPSLALAAPEAVAFQRVLRADTITTLEQPFIQSARAKGLPPWIILIRHALRPSMFSMLTLAGLSFGRLVGGAIIVENVFALPGMGRALVAAITSGDLVVLQGFVVLIACGYLVLNLFVDLVYAVLDPRVRQKV